MLEYFDIFDALKLKCVNTKFIFFHIPGYKIVFIKLWKGQSYTIFSTSYNYDNFAIAHIIDKLLYEINEKVVNLE